MNWVFVRETCEALAEVDFEFVPLALSQRLTEVFSTQPTSVVEDGSNAMRHMETRHNKTLSPPQCESGPPTSSGILTERHHYDEVPWRQQRIGVQEVPALPPRFFEPSTKAEHTSANFRSVVSTKSAGGWATTNPATYSGLALQMLCLAECSDKGCWPLVEQAWLCTCLPPGMLIRRIGAVSWWFIAGHWTAPCLNFWLNPTVQGP